MLILHDDSRNSLSEWTTEGHARPLGDLNYKTREGPLGDLNFILNSNYVLSVDGSEDYGD